MKNRIKSLKNGLFPKDADIRILSFNVLALAGMTVSLIVAFYSFFEGAGFDTVFYELLGVFFSAIMIWYTMKTGKYQFAMVITIFVVFIGIFSGIFFSDGGYLGGAPEFFVFAIVFTAFFLEGILAVVMVLIEIIWYMGICIFAYVYPETVDHFSNEKDIVKDIIVCFIIASLSLAFTMYYQVKLYNKKQKELLSAREEADIANKAKSEFIAKMSHDIRTPLNTTMAMNQLIMQNTDSEEIIRWASDSEASCTILLGLINDMLDISKIESGKLDIRIIDYSMRDMLKKLKLEWGIEADKKGLELIFDIDPAVPAVLSGGFDSLYKILSNLISNAIKYTNDGFVKVSLNRITCEDENEVELLFIVEDTGIGIPNEYLESIFLPFERGSQAVLKGKDGSGLGLAIVKELSDLMSAKVSCKSVLEKGSRFVLELRQGIVDQVPIGEMDDDVPVESNEMEKDFVVPGSHVLVVDDNFFNRKILRALLEPLMIQIDDVESGEEALEMIEIKEYDLIFMDYRMPNMDGEEVLLQIKKDYPSWHIPIVVLTADAMSGTRERLLSSGFDDFLTKPISMQHLKNVIVKFLSDKTKYFDTKEEAEFNINKETIAEYERELEKYGISFGKALELYKNNYSELFIRIEAFNKYYDKIYRRLTREKFDDESWEEYILDIHSLKATAKGIGAKALADLAALIELKSDRDFSEKTFGLLISELQFVHEGLKKVKIE